MIDFSMSCCEDHFINEYFGSKGEKKMPEARWKLQGIFCSHDGYNK